MGKAGYGFSCTKCAAIYYPVPLYEALEQTECPNCGAPVSSKSDSVFWECDNCEAHNDYDWEKCSCCDKS
jgi:tRNA(Ile2) C34 agmatinyltransferase TiaS